MEMKQKLLRNSRLLKELYLLKQKFLPIIAVFCLILLSDCSTVPVAPKMPILPKPEIPQYMQNGEDYAFVVRWAIELLFKIDEWERWYIEYKRLINEYNQNSGRPP